MNNDQIKNTTILAWWKVALMYIGLIIFSTALVSFVNPEKMYYNLAAGLIISWIITLVVYYFWAIYFYNINMGWTDADWEILEEKKGDSLEVTKDEPTVNPNASETLGLPPGTVRATLALSLLVGAMSLMLASLELPYQLEQNQFFIDNYEFIKTAFLMMVAFYFGNKSMELLKQRSPVYGPNNLTQQQDAAELPTLTSPVRGSEVKQVMKDKKAPETHGGNTGDFDDKEAQG